MGGKKTTTNTLYRMNYSHPKTTDGYLLCTGLFTRQEAKAILIFFVLRNGHM